MEPNVIYLGPEKDQPITCVIENFYNDDELNLIWQELDFLTVRDKLANAPETIAAKQNGMLLKNNWSCFLDDVYRNRNFSNILKVNRKIFTYGGLEKYNKIFDMIKYTTDDSTLLSYYENNHYYRPHFDQATFTVLSYFFREPKIFSGGDLILTDFGVEIEVENNMVVIIPSIYTHEATAISMNNDTEFNGYGRYCMAQFLHIMGKKND